MFTVTAYRAMVYIDPHLPGRITEIRTNWFAHLPKANTRAKQWARRYAPVAGEPLSHPTCAITVVVIRDKKTRKVIGGFKSWSDGEILPLRQRAELPKRKKEVL